MLPCTPIHYLLFHEAVGRPAGVRWLHEAQDLLLVTTSANPGGEPLVIEEAEACRELAGLAEGFLVHDRAILQRCDDSVLCCDHGAPAFVRRARGFVPRRIALWVNPADNARSPAERGHARLHAARPVEHRRDLLLSTWIGNDIRCVVVVADKPADIIGE